MDKAIKEVLDTMVIGCFSIPEGHQSKWFYELNERLRAAGAVTYTVKLSGAAVPVLDLDGATYIGEQEIRTAVELLETSLSNRDAK